MLKDVGMVMPKTRETIKVPKTRETIKVHHIQAKAGMMACKHNSMRIHTSVVTKSCLVCMPS